MMRIITGTAKGKKLASLEGDATRPTSERIKEAIFSSIQFEIESRRVLDLFAGSGQMGLEALSRGAESATFIDISREAMEIVKSNAKTTGFFDKCHFLASDWRNYIRKAADRSNFDLVFVDPPYAMQCCADAAKYLASSGILIPGALVVLESGEEEISEVDERFSAYDVLKINHYGKKTTVTVLFYKGEDVQ